MAAQCVEQWTFDVPDVPAKQAVECSCFPAQQAARHHDAKRLPLRTHHQRNERAAGPS